MSFDLCLACSSSLHPHSQPFTTLCCKKPICSPCISSNPRLARYNPCLACLDGVQAAGAGSRSSGLAGKPGLNLNINGAVRDEDTFVVGDDDEDDNDGPPPYIEQTPDPSSTLNSGSKPSASEDNDPSPVSSDPSEYYIQRGDTLHGIALRFGVDARSLCRLNSLPPSTLSTTPHLLHTRSVLTLPPSVSAPKPPQNIGDKLRLEAVRKSRTRERAEKRLQTMTKEVDWRVAKAYVALAEAEDEDLDQLSMKRKETGISTTGGAKAGSSSNLEMVALDRYLDDDEWEARESNARRPAGVGKEDVGVGKWFSWK